MEERNSKKGTGYFSELALRFNQEQIECAVPKNDRLPLLLNGQEIGVVTLGGSMRIRKECIL
ncbi:MAG: hypothetical protein PHE09_16885 [Oscillospiraceae bacterium]|nr:hypothetical protein [Oscillospiraceae bacterium]